MFIRFDYSDFFYRNFSTRLFMTWITHKMGNVFNVITAPFSIKKNKKNTHTHKTPKYLTHRQQQRKRDSWFRYFNGEFNPAIEFMLISKFDYFNHTVSQRNVILSSYSFAKIRIYFQWDTVEFHAIVSVSSFSHRFMPPQWTFNNKLWYFFLSSLLQFEWTEWTHKKMYPKLFICTMNSPMYVIAFS